MQRLFFSFLGLIVVILFIAQIVVFAAIGVISGAALVQVVGPYVFVPMFGPVQTPVAALVGGLVAGFLIATLSCGVMFALIAIATNTRRIKELLVRLR